MAWQDKQKWRVGDYRRLAKLPDGEYRTLLHEVTGCSSSKEGALTQVDFEIFMARIEALLEWRVTEALCPPPPAKIDLHYWRNRLAENKEANRRLVHKVYDLWGELKTVLPPEKCNLQYLFGFAARACHCRVETISEIKGWRLHLLIEGLKAHIFQSRRALAEQRAGLPGAGPHPDPVDPILPDLAEDHYFPDPESSPDTTSETVPLEPVHVGGYPALDEVPF